MSRKSNTRVYKLKNYGNMTLRVESAPVAQCLVMSQSSKEALQTYPLQTFFISGENHGEFLLRKKPSQASMRQRGKRFVSVKECVFSC